jgi:hypothetical protein
VAYTGATRTSPSLGSATPVGSLSRGTYVVEGRELSITPTDAPAYSTEVSCGANELVINGVVKVRAPAWLATHLSKQVGQLEP